MQFLQETLRLWYQEGRKTPTQHEIRTKKTIKNKGIFPWPENRKKKLKKRHCFEFQRNEEGKERKRRQRSKQNE